MGTEIVSVPIQDQINHLNRKQNKPEKKQNPWEQHNQITSIENLEAHFWIFVGTFKTKCSVYIGLSYCTRKITLITVDFNIKCIYELCHHHRELETFRGKSSKIKGVITPESPYIQENYSSTPTTWMEQWISLQHNLISMANSHKNHIWDRLSSCVHKQKGGSYFLFYFLYLIFFSSLKDMFSRGWSRRLDFINLRL